MSDHYFEPESDAAKIGGRIYREALAGRRGFRPDQLGIDESDEIWTEIFEDMGNIAAAEKRQAVREALEGVYVAVCDNMRNNPDYLQHAPTVVRKILARLDAEEPKP